MTEKNDNRVDKIANRLLSFLASSKVITGDAFDSPRELASELAGISMSQYYSAFKNANAKSPSAVEECRSVCLHPNGAFTPEVFVRRYRDGKMTAGYEFVDCIGIESEYPWWTDYESYPQDSMTGIREELCEIADDIEEIIVDERNRAMAIRSMANPTPSENSESSEEDGGMEIDMEDMDLSS